MELTEKEIQRITHDAFLFGTMLADVVNGAQSGASLMNPKLHELVNNICSGDYSDFPHLTQAAEGTTEVELKIARADFQSVAWIVVKMLSEMEKQ
jgi:hypothetical protein